MGTDSKQNCWLETAVCSPLVSAVSEKGQAFFGNPQGESTLWRLAELAEEFAAEQVATGARSLAERVSEGRSYVACIRQFKRGKSSVLNALVGNSVPPTGVVPVPTVPTIVRYGIAAASRMRFEAGAWTEIPVTTGDEYVSEEKNPQTRARYLLPHRLWLIRRKQNCMVSTPLRGLF